jgi:hypothetical protein
MRKCSPAPRNAMADYTPRIVKFKVRGSTKPLLNH